MSQLPLPIGGGRESLLIHPANADALALLRDRAAWPSHCMLLVGPRRSGRSLIGRLFAAQAGLLLVDDAHRAGEEGLFHLWNEARESGRALLLVADEPPPAWAVRLPDLRTRLAAAGVARIGPPDEAIAAALIAHGLERAGSAFAPDLPEFLARRTPRCYESIDGVVARLNALSLATGQKLSVASARQTLCNNGGLDDTADQDEREGMD